MSHPTRGAWIETSARLTAISQQDVSHPTRGAWIETEYKTALDKVYGGRTPPGVRGLKPPQILIDRGC